MGLIIVWQNVTDRYAELEKLPNGTSPEVQNNLITFAEASVHSRLGGGFATPFGSDNLTAKDLCIDTLYVQNMLSRQPEKAKSVSDSIDARINMLLSGGASMVSSAGTVAVAATGDTVWSSSANYPPVFGMSDVEKAAVSTEQLLDEDAARG